MQSIRSSKTQSGTSSPFRVKQLSNGQNTSLRPLLYGVLGLQFVSIMFNLIKLIVL